MSTSPTVALWDAVGAAIEAGENPPLALGDPRFYRGDVHGTPTPGYFLFGQAPEHEAGYYGEPGQAGRYVIHCWAPTVDDANRLYAWLKGLLHRQRLPVTGYRMIRGAMSKGPEMPDPDGQAWQVPAYYDIRAMEAAA